MEEIDTSRCMSIKCKNSTLQCTRLRKDNTEYCGIHLRAKNIIRVDSISSSNFVPPKIIVKEKSSKNDKSIIKIGDKKYDKDKIERSCKYYGIQIDGEYLELIKKINDYLNSLKNRYNASKIVLIQKIFRGWNIRRRNKSNNKEDCGTMDSIYNIPIEYFISYKEEDGFIYSFDIRTLDLICKSDRPINPYTQKSFSQTSPFWKKFQEKSGKFEKLKYDSPKLTDEQRFHQFILRVFQKFDALGQYTDIAWLENMDVMTLKKFYQYANDMFNFRAQLSTEVKKKIVKDGILFCNFIHNLHNFKSRHIKLLRFEILREMERIVDEGEDKDHKILGVNLILTVFVELVPEAAIALPHLVQSSFD